MREQRCYELGLHFSFLCSALCQDQALMLLSEFHGMKLLHGSQRSTRTIRHSLPRLPCMLGKTCAFKWPLGNIFSGPLQHQCSNYAMKPMFPARLWMLCSNSQGSWVLTRHSTTMPIQTTLFLQLNMPEYQTTRAENRLGSNSGKIKCK